MLNCLILKIIVLIRKSLIFWKKVYVSKTKDMQYFIREKIDFDEKFKKY